HGGDGGGAAGHGGYRFRGGGVWPPGKPAETPRPSGGVPPRALDLFEPSLARAPAVVSVSPTFPDIGAPPLRGRVLGAAPSHSPLVVLHLEVDPDVRVRPFDLGHRALQRDHLVGVEFGRKGVMGYDGFDKRQCENEAERTLDVHKRSRSRSCTPNIRVVQASG